MKDLEILTKQLKQYNDFEIIDCHAHMGLFTSFSINDPGELSVLDRMNKLGIDIACFSHHLAIGIDFVQGNHLSYQTHFNYPRRYLFYIVVNPWHPELLEEQLQEYYFSSKAIGIKIHPAFHNAPLDHPNFTPAFEAANRCNGIILAHIWGMDSVNLLDRLAYRYPCISFIAGHGGGDFDAMQRCMEVVGNHEHVYVDTAISRPWQGNIEWMAGKIGCKRILFGSDMPFYDAAHTLGRIILADINEKEKRDILGINMRNILNRIVVTNKT